MLQKQNSHSRIWYKWTNINWDTSKQGKYGHPRTQGFVVTDVTESSEKCSLDIQSMEYHIHKFNQKRFLDVKDVSINNSYDALKWYE